MTVNYNTFKSMKGMAIGTIIPWSGPLSGDYGVPKGWLQCAANVTLRASDYPELYNIIGTRYGGSVVDGTFALPNLPGKALTDYHPSHATDCGYTGNFSSYLGTSSDTPNTSVTTQSSNIDLKVTLGAVSGNMQALMSGMTINSSKYTTSFGYVPRRLGDIHMGSHSHGGAYPSTRITDTRIEACQNGLLTNCAFFCPDSCDNIPIPRCGNASGTTDDFCVPKYDGGEHLGRGKTPYGTNDYKMRRRENPRNYILSTDDCVLYNQRSSDAGVGVGDDGAWDGIYATTLNTNIVNFTTGAMSGHEHRTQFLTITSGNIASKDVVRINTVSNGNITPVNLDNRQVMTLTANVATPSMQMMYIIKAY